MITDTATTPAKKFDGRWPFVRDVVVFQLKMLLGSFRDFALVPVSLAAALLDLIFMGERKDYFFYKIMRWAWHSEEMINVYSLIKDEVGETEVNPDYTVDSVVARIEGVVVREYKKGEPLPVSRGRSIRCSIRSTGRRMLEPVRSGTSWREQSGPSV